MTTVERLEAERAMLRRRLGGRPKGDYAVRLRARLAEVEAKLAYWRPEPPVKSS
jgi:hypothetical protein